MRARKTEPFETRRFFLRTFQVDRPGSNNMDQNGAGGYGLSRERFGLLFAIMLVAAAGNTAMQSLMPSIGRELRIPDLWMAGAFSLSAVAWVLAAPFWAKLADNRGRRALMRRGLYGFISSSLICGLVLAAGLRGWMAPVLVFVAFTVGRAVYGIWGSASPPAVQAYIAARTEGEQRTSALAAIASSFGLGTIIGPALAPLFIFQPLGLSGPLFVFAAIGVVVLAAVVLRLPDDTPQRDAQGPIVAYPGLVGAPGEAGARRDGNLRWRDPRVSGWLVIGAVGGHGQAAALGVIGFLVIDRLVLPLGSAQESIAIVLMVGAIASLLSQWWLIPALRLSPAELVIWGSLLSAAGLGITGLAPDMYGITIGFALASLGFGLFRPGFTSGASLAVAPDEQNQVAGMVTSVNGVAYIFAPAIGVALYGLSLPLPFLITGALMAGLALWVSVNRRLSGRAESASPD
jgi:predicted MFS family arabinose efflux permease